MICYLGSTNNEKAQVFISSRNGRIRCQIRDQSADLELTCNSKKYFNTKVMPKSGRVFTE